ncbi:YebC/PmpR family DNA-binding transcriptional regulator [Patescibacteria group bacterium]|nr:YebC/PmpR family DNA-binding transcriptional regulator [Patescibacteria group bacterium]
MSGHSKWNNIKLRKGAQDKKRASIFTRLSNAITISVKKGGIDPDTNPSLRLCMQKAKEANMPKDKIEYAIKKGSSKDASNLEEVTYEFYGPFGVAFVIKCHTDNRNRTAGEVRSILNDFNLSLASPNSSQYIFVGENQTPSFKVELSEDDSEKINNIQDAFEELEGVYEILHN